VAQSTATSQESIPSESANRNDEILTAENSEDLAAVLFVLDPGKPIVADFASRYKGRTIELDGTIADVQHYGSYRTRYNILIRNYVLDIWRTTGDTARSSAAPFLTLILKLGCSLSA